MLLLVTCSGSIFGIACNLESLTLFVALLGTLMLSLVLMSIKVTIGLLVSLCRISFIGLIPIITSISLLLEINSLGLMVGKVGS